MKTCPCGSGITFLRCCDVFIRGEMLAPTPEALMRSRYTAYTQQNMDYIEKTMKGAALQGFNKQKSKASAEQITWDHLEVIHSNQAGTQGFVEFVAYYEVGHEKKRLHERSQFTFEAGQWYYIDGVILPNQYPEKSKIGRNDPCGCGSKKKFKKCCLIKA